jgi:hypothetical protein
MKKIIAFMLVPLLMLGACSGLVSSSTGAEEAGPSLPVSVDAAIYPEPAAEATSTPASEAVPTATPVTYDADDLRPGDPSPTATIISLEGNAVHIEGDGATASGTVVTITAAGTYIVSGTLLDGQLIVDTQDRENVVLVLDGMEIASSTSAPITIANAEKTIITLAEGSVNRVTDSDTYVPAPGSDEPDAAIFSHDDLTINGSGALIVNANYRNGIASKDDLKITGGEITVTAVYDAIRGRDSVAIKDGTVTVIAGADGVQSSNDANAEVGLVVIEGGTLDITAGLDGIQAATALTISGGTLTVTTGGGSAAGSRNAVDSMKGLKAGIALTITDGTITVDAADDALHSNGTATIIGGVMVLSTGDDGIHADDALRIDNGSLTITRSYEGLESAQITINDGTINIVSSDDGINVAGGQDGSGFGGGRTGRDQFAQMGSTHLSLNGGVIVIDAGGDGIDANGTIDMTDGVVLIHGPTDNWNGALDYMGTFTVSGGYLVAVGSVGMAEAPSSSSTQYAAIVSFPAALPGGTPIHIADESGEPLLSFVPIKAYQSIVISTPDLSYGTTYLVSTSGSVMGTTYGGLLTDGTTTGGAQAARFTVTEIVTGAEMGGRGMPGGPVRPGGQRP